MAELVSTRGLDEAPVSYTEALLQGKAPDGGLYVPTEYPTVTLGELRALSDAPYATIFNTIRAKLIGEDIPPEEQARITAEAYSSEKFPDAVDGNLVPVEQIGDNLFIQNLSLGPTGAFKDMALQPLAQDIEYALRSTGEGLTILGATSGDTGSAAEAAFKGLGGVTLFMLSPHTGMSAFQKAQMGELSGGNIHNLSIDGPFDLCNSLLDYIQGDPEFQDIAAVNSINWGRIISQVPYYFSGYLQAVGENIGEQVDFVVPTGNFGNVLAGHIARRMGLPIRKLVAANNENNVMHHLTQTGQYVKRESEVTSSPSTDICRPRNYERLLYELFAGDGEKVANYMQRFAQAETAGQVAVTLNDYGLSASAIKDLGFGSGYSTDADRAATITATYYNTDQQLVVDPHTADGITVAQSLGSEVKTICFATALPVKFEPMVFEALGFVPQRPERFKQVGLADAEQDDGFVQMNGVPEVIAAYIREHRGASQAESI